MKEYLILNGHSEYWFECPNCGEPVALSIDPNSTSNTELTGYCQNCHLTIFVSKYEYEQWKEENFEEGGEK